MDEETHEALVASIEKWKRNAVAEDPGTYSVSWKSCPLCALFYLERSCVGCPVSARTGEPCCDDTPYVLAERLHDRWYDARTERLERDYHVRRAQDAARIEVGFLQSLLPEGDPARGNAS